MTRSKPQSATAQAGKHAGKLDRLMNALDAVRDAKRVSARDTLRVVLKWSADNWTCLALYAGVNPHEITAGDRADVFALLRVEAESETLTGRAA